MLDIGLTWSRLLVQWRARREQAIDSDVWPLVPRTLTIACLRFICSFYCITHN